MSTLEPCNTFQCCVPASDVNVSKWSLKVESWVSLFLDGVVDIPVIFCFPLTLFTPVFRGLCFVVQIIGLHGLATQHGNQANKCWTPKQWIQHKPQSVKKQLERCLDNLSLKVFKSEEGGNTKASCIPELKSNRNERMQKLVSYCIRALDSTMVNLSRKDIHL